MIEISQPANPDNPKDLPGWYIVGARNGDFEQELDVQVNWEDVPLASRVKVQSVITFVLTVLTSLVDHEEDVKLHVHANHRRMCITARVHEDDVRFAIGAHGAHANALRSLLIAACKKLDYHFELDIGGPSGAADWSSS